MRMQNPAGQEGLAGFLLVCYDGLYAPTRRF